MADAPVEVQPDELLLACQVQQQASLDAEFLDPWSCPGLGMKLCTHILPLAFIVYLVLQIRSAQF